MVFFIDITVTCGIYTKKQQFNIGSCPLFYYVWHQLYHYMMRIFGKFITCGIHIKKHNSLTLVRVPFFIMCDTTNIIIWWEYLINLLHVVYILKNINLTLVRVPFFIMCDTNTTIIWWEYLVNLLHVVYILKNTTI